MLSTHPLEGSTVTINRFTGGFSVPEGYYYYHVSAPSANFTLLDSDGEIFCQLSDSTTSPIYFSSIFFGPNIYFDIGQRDSTEE